MAAGRDFPLRRYLADPAARDFMRVAGIGLAAILFSAIFMLVSTISDIDQERDAMRESLAQGIRDEFALRLDTTSSALFQVAKQVRNARAAEEALAKNDGTGLSSALAQIYEDAKADARISGLVVYDAELKPLFSPQNAGAKRDVAPVRDLDKIRAHERPVMRLTTDPQGNCALSLILPWIVGQKTVGFIAVWQDSAAMFDAFEKMAQTDIYLVPQPTGSDVQFPGALLDRLGGPDSSLVSQVRRQLNGADGINAKTLDLQGAPSDIITIRAKTEGVDDLAYFIAVHDVGRRENALAQVFLRRTLMWFVCLGIFIVTCLWLSVRLTRQSQEREQQRFREREQRVSAVMNAVVDGIVTIRTDGAILTFNPAAESMFGYSASDVIGENVSLLTPTGLAAQHQNFVDRYLETGQRHVIGVKREISGRRKDGTEFPMDIAVSQSTVGGEVIFIGVLRDVTDRKLANDLLLEALRHQKEAQQALRRRSDELVRAAKALTLARDKAEAANEAKSRFLAAMSHELRTPMNGILGMAQLLAQSSLAPEQRKWAGHIRESGEALLTLLNDILDLSKIEAGRFMIRPQPFDALGLTRQLVESWEHLSKDKGVELRLEQPEHAPALIGDALRIRQILANYVSNALKFTSRGYITVRLNITAHNDSVHRLRYEVSDTGMGIPEDKIPLLFEKFNEINIDESRRHNGAGLGLAICREIAGLMGGQVGVESVLGIGSIFWLEVALPVEIDETKTPLQARPMVETADDRSDPIRILIAEDHPVNQKLFQALLSHMGHEVTIVSNGEEAIAALDRTSYDLVLMDANMPVMDGAEATKRIRARGGADAQVPIIAVTAEAMVGDRERFLSLGMDDYLTKPIDAKELAELIARHARNGKPSLGETAYIETAKRQAG